MKGSLFVNHALRKKQHTFGLPATHSILRLFNVHNEIEYQFERKGDDIHAKKKERERETKKV